MRWDVESETWDVVIGKSVRGTLTEIIARGRGGAPYVKGYEATIVKTGEQRNFSNVEDAYDWVEGSSTRRDA